MFFLPCLWESPSSCAADCGMVSLGSTAHANHSHLRQFFSSLVSIWLSEFNLDYLDYPPLPLSPFSSLCLPWCLGRHYWFSHVLLALYNHSETSCPVSPFPFVLFFSALFVVTIPPLHGFPPPFFKLVFRVKLVGG